MNIHQFRFCGVCGQTDTDAWGKCVHCGAPFPEEFTELVNCTTHELVVYDEQGGEVLARLAFSGTVARCDVVSRKVGQVVGVPTFDTQFGEVRGLPDPEEGKMYVVSLPVRQALPERHDLASPGELIRDEAGRPVGCKGLNVNK